MWESISNEKTNEILSIDYDESDEDGISVAIKRCAKDKKNSRETE